MQLYTDSLHKIAYATDASVYREIPYGVAYPETIELEKNAKIVMTDSGGVQKEAFFFEKPCIIFRPETEWVEIVNHDAGIIADADKQRILDAYSALTDKKVTFPALFGDGHASEFILSKIIEYLA